MLQIFEEVSEKKIPELTTWETFGEILNKILEKCSKGMRKRVCDVLPKQVLEEYLN